MRVAVLFDNFGPYHVARLAGAAEVMDVLGVEFRAKSKVYDWMQSDVPASLQHVTLQAGSDDGSWRGIEDACERLIKPFAPDAVAVGGWSSMAAIAAACWARKAGIPTILMSETNNWDFKRVGPAERVKQRFARSFSAGLCGGEGARAYLVGLGLSPDAIFLGYDAVDNDYFARGAGKIAALGVMPDLAPGVPMDAAWRGRYFLASARFIAKKNLPALLTAYAAYRQMAVESSKCWPLVLLGDGSMRQELEQLRAQLGLERTVMMPGFQQYDELPGFYGTAGAFIHASTTEQWGLVVNEAMASSLPVLVSERCGCVEALVTDGENGFTFDPADVQAITRAMSRVAASPDRQAMAAASRRRIADWGPARFAAGLQSAAAAACERGAKPMSFGDRLLLRGVAEVQSRRT